MRIFVTGNRGYIGSHLVDLLKAEGHTVTGCDLGLYRVAEWDPVVNPDEELVKDVRLLTEKDVEGHDCIMHLAAISNDPMGELDSNVTKTINADGSIRLAEVAKRAGVPRFLFASSCSMYGKGVSLDLDETAELNPVSLYAQSKIDAEKGIHALADDSFSPASLRNATAYGYSPVLRVDLVLNNLLASALSYGELRVMSDGSPWRPLIHCRDIARAFVAFGNANKEQIHNQAINVGGDSENYQVKDVVSTIQNLLPETDVVFTGEVGVDPRNYRVKFDKLNAQLPEFKLEYNLARGAEELLRKMRDHGFDRAAFEGDTFVRLRTLRTQLEKIVA